MVQLLPGFTDHSVTAFPGRSAGFRSWLATVGTSGLIEPELGVPRFLP